MFKQYNISRDGLIFVASREALVLVAYQDGKHMSIGFGHNNPKLKPGDTITPKDAFRLLREDMAAREKVLSKMLTREATQNQFDMMLSLHYQSGYRYMVKRDKYPGPFVVQAFNDDGPEAAAALFPECSNNAKGEYMGGLHTRRVKEQHAFVTGEYGNLDTIPFWDGDPRTHKRKEYTLLPGDL